MTEKKSEGCLLPIVVLTGALVSALASAWLIAKLWSWFVVPGFGLPPITIVDAAGVELIVAILLLDQFWYLNRTVQRIQKAIAGEREEYTELEANGFAMAAKLLVVYPLALLIGWLWTLLR